jgi:hypothetical protein
MNEPDRKFDTERIRHHRAGQLNCQNTALGEQGPQHPFEVQIASPLICIRT